MNTTRLLALMLIELVIFLPVSFVYAIRLDNITITDYKDTTTALEWLTDTPGNSTVLYGENHSISNNVTDETFSRNHHIEIPTTNGKNYTAQPSSCDVSGACATGGQVSFNAGPDTTPPTLNITAPQFSTTNSADISVETEPLAIVRVYVKGILSRIAQPSANPSGKVMFRSVTLPDSLNTVRIEAEDKAHNSNSQQITITVDTQPPIINISDMPAILTTEQATLSGRVNEWAQIDIFSRLTENLAPPDVVKGVAIAGLTSESVTLQWTSNTDQHILEYGIYRDQKLIGTSRSTTFSDMNVMPGKKYSYRVQAVDTSCNKGMMSSTVDVAVPSGNAGAVIGTPTPEFTCDRALYHIETDGSFAQPLQLRDGPNEFTIVVTDRAGNKAKFTRVVNLDKTPPTILEHNLDAISPSYTQTATIKGKISEKANVLLFVNDMNKPQTYVTTEDDGIFSADIKLSRNITLERNSLDSGNTGVAGVIGVGTDNLVKIQAIDKAGLTAEYGPVTATYAMCGFGAGWQTNVGKPSPSILVPKLILDGFGVVGTNIELKYTDIGTPEAVRASVHVRALSKEEQGKYDLDFTPTIRIDQKNFTKAYLEVRVNPPPLPESMTQLDKEDNISNNRKGDCLLPGYGCFKMPMVIEIQYDKALPTTTQEQTVTGVESPVKIERQIFKQCVTIEVAADKRISPKILPNAFLKSTVNLFNQMIDAINKVLDPLQTVFNVVFYTCLLGFYIAFFMDFAEKSECLAGAPVADSLVPGGFNFNVAQVGMCNAVYPSTDEKLSKSNLACVKCQKKIVERENMFNQLKWFCDRIFCPSAPSLQRYIREAQTKAVTEIKTVKLPPPLDKTKILQGSDCATKNIDFTKFKSIDNTRVKLTLEDLYNDFKAHKNDKPTMDAGVPDKAMENPSKSTDINCASLHPFNPTCCAYEYNKNWQSVCSIGQENYELTESLCLGAQRSGEPGVTQSVPGCGSTRKLLNEQAGFCSRGGNFTGELVRTPFTYGELTSDERKDYDSLIKEQDNNRLAEENEYGVTIRNSVTVVRNEDDKRLFDSKATNKLLTGGLATGPDPTKGKLSPAIKERQMWIRVLPPGAEGELAVERGYLLSNAKLAELPNLLTADQRGQSSTVTQTQIFVPDGVQLHKFFQSDAQGVPPVYKQEDWISALCSVNPDPKGRSRPNVDGCNAFAARQVYDEIKAKIGIGDKDYIVNPAEDIASSIKCACLPGILTHLKKWRGIVTAVKNCFNTILATGQGNAGACNAVLSRYVCDSIYLLLKCYVKQYDYTQGRSIDSSSGGLFGIGNIGATLTQAGSSVQQQLQGRYGNSPTYQAAFSEQKIVNSICLFAFTGTWNLNAEVLASTDIGTIPVDSQPFLFPCERRFLTFDSANQGLATFDYHLGADLFAGADVTYTVSLKCSQGPMCDPVQGFKDGMCDCDKIGEKKMVVDSGQLKQFENIGEKGELFKNVQSAYRYDRALIEWSYRDKDQKAVNDKLECKLEQVGGDPPAFCAFDILSNSYRCGVDFFNEYYAKFSGNPEAEYGDVTAGAFRLGDRIRFGVPIVQRIPETAQCSNGICDSSKFLLFKITNKNRGIIYSNMGALAEPQAGGNPGLDRSNIVGPDSSALLSTNGDRRYIIDVPDVLNSKMFTLGSIEQTVPSDINPAKYSNLIQVSFDPSNPSRTETDLIFKVTLSSNACSILTVPTAVGGVTPSPTLAGTCTINNNRIEYKGINIQLSENLKNEKDLPTLEIHVAATKNIGTTSQLMCDPKKPSTNPETWTAVFEIHDVISGSGGVNDPSPTVSTVQGATQRRTVTFKTICNTEYRGEEGKITGECSENRNLKNDLSSCYCKKTLEDLQRAVDNKESRNCGGTLSLSQGMVCVDGTCIKQAQLDANFKAGFCPANEKLDFNRAGCLCGENNEVCSEGDICRANRFASNKCEKATTTGTGTSGGTTGTGSTGTTTITPPDIPSIIDTSKWPKEFVFPPPATYKEMIPDVTITEYHVADCNEYGYPGKWKLDTTPASISGPAACAIPDSQKGFFEAVKCEGSGTCNGKTYSSSSIDVTEEWSTEWFVETASDTEPIVRRTIAVNWEVPPVARIGCVIPKGSWVYVKFPDLSNLWTGWYKAEDTGATMRDDAAKGTCHIDIFAGTGKAAGKQAVREFGSAKPTLYVIDGEPGSDTRFI